MGPYFSAMLPSTLWGGSAPPNRWRWPITGHAPPAFGAAFFLPVPAKNFLEIQKIEQIKIKIKNMELEVMLLVRNGRLKNSIARSGDLGCNAFL
jgi:hypothetical protein